MEKVTIPGAVYVLEMEIPEILGSGSNIREITRTKNFDEVMQLYQQGRGNRITRYCRVDGKLISKVWDELEGDFV